MSRSVYDTILSAVSSARRAGLDSADQRMAARVVLLANDTDLSPGIAQLLVDQIYLDICPPDGSAARVLP